MTFEIKNALILGSSSCLASGEGKYNGSHDYEKTNFYTKREEIQISLVCVSLFTSVVWF